MTAQKKLSGRDACVAAIRAAGTPLSANAIASAVVETGVVPTLGATGKTPKATLAAQITSGAKKGTTFAQVGESRPKLYDVLEGVADSDPQVVQTLKGYFDRAAAEPVAETAAETAPTDEPTAETPAAPAKAKRSSKAAKPDPKPQSTPRARRGRKPAAA